MRLFAPLDVRDGDGRQLDELLRRPKRIALLAYLAAARPRGFQRRDKLVGMFWPESPQGRARHALSQALSVLRAEMGESAIVTRGDEEVAVNYELISVDVVEFDRAIDRGDLEVALRGYHGDLLDGFFLSSAPEFEHWLDFERTRLRRAAGDAATTLAGRARGAGDDPRALEWARRAAALAPCDEPVALRLMELLATGADRAGALAVYEDLVRRLREQFELDPSPEIRAAAERIRSGKAVERPEAPAAPTPRLVPRADAGPTRPGLPATGDPEFSKRYRMEGRVGQGGMADVFAAQDLRYDRRVAIKILRPELAKILGPERFVREIETVASLSHPHILPLLDSGEIDGQFYYVMPYVEGGSLRDRVVREKQLPIEHAVQIARDVALALDYAHRKGVVHRDVKPENILLVDGEALLTDFGIAYRLPPSETTRLTAAGIAVGTPEYLSPEQAGGQPFDQRADVYALGCVVFEMLVGDAPFVGPDAQIVLARKRAAPAPDVRAFRETVPPALSDVVARALARTPADRFPTAAQLAMALTRSLSGSASAPGMADRARRRPRRVNQPPSLAPSYFQDRRNEIDVLVTFLRDESKRLLTVVGRPGLGKTAMVCRTLEALEAGDTAEPTEPLRLDAVVYLSVYDSGHGLFPKLFSDLCKLLPDGAAESVLKVYQNAQLAPADKMKALLEKFSDLPAVVVLDNLEDAIEPNTGRLADPELSTALRSALELPHHTVKLILTTRTAPRDLIRVQPGRQSVLHLDEGLPSPYAEQILRQMDADSRVGLSTASEELLKLARDRTQGNPRALEALFAVLATDRATSLDEILNERPDALPPDVLEAFIGEAYRRLDRSGQVVMQALAVCGRPVPATAVERVIGPVQPQVNCGDVLRELVNLQLARRDTRGFYLHPADQAYVLGRLADEAAHPSLIMARQFLSPDVPGASSSTLKRGAADYFRSARSPRDQWRSLDDLAAPLAEYELRVTNHDFNGAAEVLRDIAFDYLLQWGHHALVVSMYERIRDHITDPSLQENAASVLGTTYWRLGHYDRAVAIHQEALTIARALRDRDGEAASLGNLGTCLIQQGYVQRALEHHFQALDLHRQLGDREGEAYQVANAGTCLAAIGQYEPAIEGYKRALAYGREIRDRRFEARQLGNLGIAYGCLGDTARAIESLEQAHRIATELGDRLVEAGTLVNLGHLFIDRTDWATAVSRYEAGIRIADEMQDPDLRARAYYGMSLATLCAGDLSRSRSVAEQAQEVALTLGAHDIVMLGVILARSQEFAKAEREFSRAIRNAEALLTREAKLFAALDSKGLALAGLALVTRDQDRAAAAAEAYRAARSICRAPGIVNRTVMKFHQLVVADEKGVLSSIRPDVAGESPH